MLTKLNRKLISCYSAAILSMTAINAGAFDTVRISLTPTGGQASGSAPSVNADGRFVTMSSNMNLSSSPDVNNLDDVFFYDRLSKISKLVSVSSAGVQGNAYSANSVISADNRYVAFSTWSTNLVAGDTNNTGDVFVRDTQTNITTRVSVSSSGVQANNGSGFPSISTDGRYVAFTSYASNLVAGDTNNGEDIFVRDRVTNQTTRVSLSSASVQGDSYSIQPSISGDGRYVAFSSRASNLVAGDTNGEMDVFVRDRTTNQTTRVNLDSSGNQGTGGEGASISADGRYVAFVSHSNLVAGTPFFAADVFVRDRQTGTTIKSSLNIPSLLPSGVSWRPMISNPKISADGRYVVFSLVAFDNIYQNSVPLGVRVFDRVANTTTRVDKSPTGIFGNSFGYNNPVISADGRFVVFDSVSTNLVSGDTNGTVDVFYHDRVVDKTQSADLAISVIQKPASLVLNTNGTYVYKIINNGPNTVSAVRLIHVLSNSTKLISLLPSQGSCALYANISRCFLNALLPGASVTVTATAKAERNPLIQRVSVSGAPVDAVPSNNRSYVETPVTP